MKKIELPDVGDGYFITTDARIYRRRNSGLQQLSVFKDRRGHQAVQLRSAGGYKIHRVSTLMAREFLGLTAQRIYLEFVDGNPDNCALDNLRASKKKAAQYGENHTNAKLTTTDCQFIRNDQTMTHQELADHFGVHKSNIYKIKSRASRNHEP